MWRKFIRWAGFLHDGPIRIKPRHWWQWRRANRVERFLNWQAQQPEFKAAQEKALLNAILYGGYFAPPPGFYGYGIGDMLTSDELTGAKRN